MSHPVIWDTLAIGGRGEVRVRGRRRNTDRVSVDATPTAARGFSPPRAAAVCIVVLSWGSALPAVVLGAASGQDWVGVLRVVITAGVYAPVAAVLLMRRRRALAALLGALAVTSGLLALTAVVDGVVPGGIADLFSLVAVIARQPEIASIGILPWLLVARSNRWRSWAITLGFCAIALDLALALLRVAGVAVPRAVFIAPLVCALVGLATAAVALVRQWRRGSDRERALLGWLGAGAALLLASYVRLAVDLAPVATGLSDAAFMLAQALLSMAVLAAALQDERAPDARLLAGIVQVQSLACGVGVYLAVDAIGTTAGLSPQIAGAVGAAALALAFGPVSGFLRRRATLLFHGPTVDARRVLAHLGDRLGDADEPAEDALRAMAQSLREVWGLASVRIAPAGETAPVQVGARAGAAATIPLRTGERYVGELELTHDDAELLREWVVPVVDEVAALIGVAVLLAAVNADVAETRRRTLGVRREERRMLSRELLDGLAPALAGIGFGIAAAGHRLAQGAPIRDDLGALRSEVSAGAEDVRRLARALLPTALDAGDLEAALTSLAQRLTAEGTPVAVRAVGADVLDADTQMSVYLALSEGLSRLARTNGVDAIAVGLTIDEDSIRLDLAPTAHELAPASRAAVRDAVARVASDVGGAVETDAAPPGSFRVVMRR